MKKLIALIVLLFAVSGFDTAFNYAQETKKSDQPTKIDFNRQVKPILSDRCFLCHGPDAETREADLRLDLEEDAHAAIEPGSSEDSELIYRIMSEDDPMPPEDSNLSLTEEDKQILKQWVDEGAKWEQHWAFVNPVKAEVPKPKRTDWAQGPIDQFILRRLESEGVQPASPATKEKLLRRLTFDLTGLPPTLEELDAFLSDESKDAYEKAVDLLLASPRYGERMTADWLDVARYSDTYGYQVDRNRYVWPWRDWVIRSFNANMGYDQFITEQLAGDLLPSPTDDQILATTFNRLHPQKVEGGSVEEEFRVEYVADRMQTAGMALLGLTVECARCHDHKYDPLSQKEYYELFAFFNNIDESGLYSYFDAEAIPSPSMLLLDEKQKANLKQLRDEIKKHEQDAKRLIDDYTQKSPDSAYSRWLASRPKSIDVDAIPGLQMKADFEEAGIGRNILVDVEAENLSKRKGVKLTGDDEIKFETGSFQRHQPFTVATWIKIPNDPQLLKRSVIYHRSRAWTDSASRGYQLLIKNGKLSASLIHFWPGNAISVESAEKVPTDQWIQVVVRYDGSSKAEGIELFINGDSTNIDVIRDNLQKKIVGNGTDRLIIGARFRDIGFKNGEMGELKVFDRMLSSLEISSLHDVDSANKQLTKPADELNIDDETLLLEHFLLRHDKEFTEFASQLSESRKTLNTTVDGTSEIMVMKEMPKPRPAYLLERGAYDARGEEVHAATPGIFPPMPKGDASNRLGLAKWFVSNEHPLTARVAVNHYWQLLFGEGLVRTPEDFGSQGQPPTHPELLDWLAVDFREHGWDVKRLLKQIVMSRTYQQSTAASTELLKKDPNNELLARAPTYRLPAEMIRDNVLHVSGLLVEKIGGAPVKPYDLEKSFKPSKPDTGEGLYRRSLYTFWQRNGPAPLMLTLDAAKRDVCQVKRERTSSPLAALVQLNNPQSVEASRKLAEKLYASRKGDTSAVALDLFRALTSRTPSEKEHKVLVSLFGAQQEYFLSDEKARDAFLAVGASKVDEALKDKLSDVAAWASVANTLLSFDECVMKR